MENTVVGSFGHVITAAVCVLAFLVVMDIRKRHSASFWPLFFAESVLAVFVLVTGCLLVLLWLPAFGGGWWFILPCVVWFGIYLFLRAYFIDRSLLTKRSCQYADGSDD